MKIGWSHFQEQIYDTRGLLKDQTKADLAFMLRSEKTCLQHNWNVCHCLTLFVFFLDRTWNINSHTLLHYVQIVPVTYWGANLRNIMEYQHLYSTEPFLQQPRPNARSSTIIYWCLFSLEFEYTCLPSFLICLPQTNMFGCSWCLLFVNSEEQLDNWNDIGARQQFQAWARSWRKLMHLGTGISRC